MKLSWRKMNPIQATKGSDGHIVSVDTWRGDARRASGARTTRTRCHRGARQSREESTSGRSLSFAVDLSWGSVSVTR